MAQDPLAPSSMRDLFDEYGRKARLFPALLCVPPYLLVGHYAIRQFFDPAVASRLYITIGDISLAVVLLYLLIQLNRLVSKAWFQDEKKLPTVTMLLPSDTTFSPQYKQKIADRVVSDFGLALPTPGEEAADPVNARKRTAESIELIIERVGAGRLLLQHNTEYGFVRNLVGGALLAFLVSVVAAVVFATAVPNKAALSASVVLAVLYILPVLLHRVVLRRPSEDYARVLFREYVGA